MIYSSACSVTSSSTWTASGPTTVLTPLTKKKEKNCLGDREKETPLLFGKTKLQIWRNNRVLAPYYPPFLLTSKSWTDLLFDIDSRDSFEKVIDRNDIQGLKCYNARQRSTGHPRATVDVYLYHGKCTFLVGWYIYENTSDYWYDIFRDPTWLGQGEKKEAFFKEMFTENNVFLFYKCFNEGFSHWERTLNY